MVEKAQLASIRGMSLVQFGFALLNDDDSEASCRLAEERRTLNNRPEYSILKGSLFYDKRKRGNRGRCLRNDLEFLRLQKGDRLEPSPECADIGQGFDSINSFPITLTFWRMSAQTWVLHRNPLFSVTSLGIRLFMVDSLHTINLGLLHRWLWRCLWHLVDHNAWRVPSEGDQRLQQSMHMFRSSMFSWLSRRSQQMGSLDLTPPEDFTHYHLGSRKQALMKTKGAATQAIVMYTCDALLPTLLHIPLAEHLLGSGKAILEYLAVAKAYKGSQPDEATCQRLVDLGLTHLRLAKAAGVPFSPKHHLFLHLLFQTLRAGSPADFNTFMDESLNRMMSSVSKAAYHSVWEMRIQLCVRCMSAKKRGGI